MGKPAPDGKRRDLRSVLALVSEGARKKIEGEKAEEAKIKQAENSLAASKEQIGKQAALSAQRAAAEGAARDLAATSQAAPDVAVDTGAPVEDDTSAGGVKRRRQRFGIGTESSGVNI